MARDLVIGVKQTNDQVELSSTGSKILGDIAASSFILKNKWDQNKVRVFYVTSASVLKTEELGEVKRIAFVGYSAQTKKDKLTEELHLKQQFDLEEVNDATIDDQNRARDAAAAALKALFDDDREQTVEVLFDDFDGNSQYVAEGAYLASYQFYLDEKKEQELKKTELSLIEKSGQEAWNKGRIISVSQNFARWLEELPANYCTPIKFCEYASKRLEGTHITIEVHDETWAKEKKMNSFLSVSSGSDEPPRVFEARYINNPKKSKDEIDLVLVGKGVCFDSGGYSLKPGPDMKLMKSDMGGSATVVAVLSAIAQLELPLNVVAITMMVENMINGKATRPGDVITASNGKTIEIDNTDAEGRLALADGLVFASQTYKPDYLVDLATLTGAIGVALGSHCAGCFTSSNSAWKILEKAGYETNEYFWRMPLFRAVYKKQLKALSADLNNIGGAAGGSCTAAAFLAEFVDFNLVKNYVHLDIAKVVIPTPSECGTGRPTRAVIRFAELLSNK